MCLMPVNHMAFVAKCCSFDLHHIKDTCESDFYGHIIHVNDVLR